MHDFIAFGIGCFHFGVKMAPPFILKGQDYVEKLQRALESIPTVSNINIDADEEFRKLEIEVTEPLSEIDEGPDFFPPPALFLDIDFEIYIPTRLQNELLPSRDHSDTKTEKFAVHISDNWYFPVTFVETINPDGDNSPSDAVVIVREFLNKHFVEAKSEWVNFEFLGPSPFHADFFLRSKRDVDNETEFDISGFEALHIPIKGYATIEFVYDPTLYDGLSEAKQSLYDELADEVGLYYRMTQLGVRQMRGWGSLQIQVRRLLDAQKATGIRTLVNRLFRVYSQIQDAVIALSEFETDQIWIGHGLKTDYLGLLRGGRTPYIDPYIQDFRFKSADKRE